MPKAMMIAPKPPEGGEYCQISLKTKGGALRHILESLGKKAAELGDEAVFFTDSLGRFGVADPYGNVESEIWIIVD